MKTYTIYEAKTQFSDLVKRAVRGETIRIGAHGKPAVELRALPEAQEQRPKSYRGVWAGKMRFAPDYDRADEEIAEAMNRRFNR